MLDVFNADAFSVTSLTDAVNAIKFVPGRIGALGLFQESGVATTSVVIEERDGVLSLVSPTPRGGPGSVITKALRTARPFIVPHFEINDAVMAEEVQNVRAWGSETEVEMVQGKVAERLAIHSQSMEATIEYARIGAIKGIVTYGDGSTLDLFTEFGVSQEA
ncbi:MAG: major capsid protein, partial [Mesorhizobium sp.]